MTEYENKTTELLFQNYDVLSKRLQEMVIGVPGTSVKIILTKLDAYPLAENQTWLYRPLQSLQITELWARYHPLRKMSLSLLNALDSGRLGACVRIHQASRIDEKTGLLIPLKREGDIAEILGLAPNEVGRLRFLDDTNVLFLERTGRIVDKIPKDLINPSQADHELESFFE